MSPLAATFSRSGVRLRLTLLYGALFLLCGTALLALTYGLVRANFTVPSKVVIKASKLTNGQDVVLGPGVEPLDPSAIMERKVLTPADGPTLKAYARAVEAAAYRQLLVWSGLALGLMAVVSLWLGWVVAGRILRPLQAVTAAAKRLSGQNLHRERIALQGPHGELKELADTFDAMLGRLDAAFSSQRRFVANASHELRTPLAIVRTEVDVALANPATSRRELRDMAERVRAATERSEQLIESLLLLARSEREPRAREPVDLSEAATDALCQARPQVESLGLRISQVLGVGPVAGDRPLLERMVANLVENAVRHNRPDGWIEVDTGASGPVAQLRVSNSGPVIPPDQVESLFEPFHRHGRDRTRSDRGVGLGLSIVRSVATAHGGGVDARALPGGGLEVVVTLPRLGGPPRPRAGLHPRSALPSGLRQ